MRNGLMMAMVAGLLLQGTSLAAAQQQTTVTFAGYSGIFQDYFVEHVVAPFEAANPDIKIDYFAMVNSSQLVGQLVAQAADPTIDVVFMDLVFSKSATDQNLFEKLTPDLVPSIADLNPNYAIDGIAGVPVTRDTLALVYNPKLVNPAPTSWTAFADAAWAGKVAVSGPPGMFGVGLTIIYDRMEGGDSLTDLSKGIDYLVGFAPNVQSFEAKDFAPQVQSGELAMSQGWNARSQITASTTDGAIGVVTPAEGTVLQVNTINLVQNAKHRDAALKFIDYLLSKPAQEAIANNLFYTPVNAKVELPAETVAKLGGADLASKVLDVDLIALAPVIPEITQAWQRQVIPAGR